MTTYASGYDEIVEGFGYTIVATESTGSYQGDTHWLLTDGSRWGYLVFGYGSCSGCDAYDRIDLPWTDEEPSPEALRELAELADRMRGDIRWYDTADECRAALTAPLPENDWYWNDDEVIAVLARFAAAVTA